MWRVLGSTLPEAKHRRDGLARHMTLSDRKPPMPLRVLDRPKEPEIDPPVSGSDEAG